MAIDTSMVALRARHPVRLTLVCVVLVMAGGSVSIRGAYAEVAAAAALAGARTRQAERASALRTSTVAHSRRQTATVAPADPQLVVAARYLRHCSLLL
ncbi:MAG: hypothetical protein JWN44_5942 [Myxococcales bacterium]|nr:hypothetical protein [Myxococcales bacterium]